MRAGLLVLAVLLGACGGEEEPALMRFEYRCMVWLDVEPADVPAIEGVQPGVLPARQGDGPYCHSRHDEAEQDACATHSGRRCIASCSTGGERC